MKTLIFGLLAGLTLLQVRAEEPKWFTDLPKAQEQAKAEKKLVIMDFTASDWCYTCMKLKKEVFSSSKFADYAKKNLVLMEVDFPSKKPQSDDLKKANLQLAEKYNVEGFPTVIVLDSGGKKIGQLSYDPGDGPKPFIAELEKLKKKS